MTDVIPEKALYAILSGSPAITAMVGPRIWPIRLPSLAVPALVYRRVSTNVTHGHDGPAGFQAARFQLDCWALTHLASREVANAVDGTLNGFDGTVLGVRVQKAKKVLDLDDPHPDTGLERVILDYALPFYTLAVA